MNNSISNDQAHLIGENNKERQRNDDGGEENETNAKIETHT